MHPEKKSLAAIALGSNVGDRAAHLDYALQRLGALGRVRAASKYFETEPVGTVQQGIFLNAAALLETELAPEPLLQALLEIERERGRDRAAAPPKGPRTLDLDLLLYKLPDGVDEVMQTESLTLPHPEMHRRRFVLEPLAEIAPEWVHPQLKKSIQSLL